jgi:hypothetical protein
MNPAGYAIGLGLGVLIAGLWPVSGLVILTCAFIRKRTRRFAKVITALAAATLLVLAPWLPWDPSLSLVDNSVMLLVYFFCAAKKVGNYWRLTARPTWSL